MDCRRTGEEGWCQICSVFLLSNIFIVLAGLFTPCLWLSGAAGCRGGGSVGAGTGDEGGRIREMWDPSRKMVEEGRKSRGRRAEGGVSVGGSLCALQAKGAGTDVCVCRRGVVELFIQPGC